MKRSRRIRAFVLAKVLSTWDEADALDFVATTIEQELIKGESTEDISVLSETLKEVEKSPILELVDKTMTPKKSTRC